MLEVRKPVFKVSTISHTEITDLKQIPPPPLRFSICGHLYTAPGGNPALQSSPDLTGFCDSFDCRISALRGKRINESWSTPYTSFTGLFIWKWLSNLKYGSWGLKGGLRPRWLKQATSAGSQLPLALYVWQEPAGTSQGGSPSLFLPKRKSFLRCCFNRLLQNK